MAIHTFPDFLIIPRQLVEDKTLQPTDRILYGAIYWLEQLKDGRCTASNRVLASICNVTERAVQGGLLRLETAGHVKRILGDRGERVEIRGLVSYASRTNEREGTNKRAQGGRTNVPQNKKTIKRKDNNTHTEDGVGGKVVAEIIDLFGAVNPSHRLLFMRNNQRDAVQRLLSQYGEDRLRAMIAYLPKSNADTYAPTITTPLELEGKMGKLVAWAQKQKTRSTSKSKELIA